MSPASYQTAPPRVAVSVNPAQSGKRDSNPRPQPWQGCALPTELFPRALQCNRALRRLLPPGGPWSASGGEGDRTPDLVNAIHALSQLSYAPVIFARPLGPSAGTRHCIGAFRGCQAESASYVNFRTRARYHGTSKTQSENA